MTKRLLLGRSGIRFKTVLGLSIVFPLLAIGLPIAFGVGSSAERSLSDAIAVLEDETVAHVRSEVENFLEVPLLVNRMNAEAVKSGRVDPGDADTLESLFLSRIGYTPSVTSVYFGNARGGLVDAGREGPDGSLYVIRTDGFAAGSFVKTAIDDRGAKSAAVSVLPQFDARTRPWYRAAVAAGAAAWTPPYPLFTGQDSAVSAVLPLNGADGTLIGVFSVDIFLSQLERFLKGSLSRLGGHCFISDSSGAVLARSDKADGFDFLEGEALRSSGGGDAAFTFSAGKVRYFGESQRLSGKLGLDWHLVLLYPDTAFMAGIRYDRGLMVLAVLLGALVSALLSFVIASRFARPLELLSGYARSLSSGEWPAPPRPTRLIEPEELRTSLAAMADRLRESIEALTAENEAKRIANERVEALLAEKTLILREVHHRIKNNMSSIASLLAIEARSMDDGRATAALLTAESRVGSMMILYDKLYRSDRFTEASAAAFFEEIVRDLSRIYDPFERVSVETDCAAALLPAETLMPLGLILNEALTNAYKYAFAEGRRGKISVRFLTEGGEAVFVVGDDGRGISLPPDGFHSGGFGLTLMESLAEQLGGTFAVAGDEGTTVSVRFPLPS